MTIADLCLSALSAPQNRCNVIIGEYIGTINTQVQKRPIAAAVITLSLTFVSYISHSKFSFR